jgi:type I restriction enzyme S subunit
MDSETTFKETEIGLIPEKWDVKELGELVTVKSGKRLPKGKTVVTYKTKHPYIRIRDLANGTVNVSDVLFINEEAYEDISRYIITKDDVYVSIVGTIGLVGTIPNELDNANLTENCARLTNIRGTTKEWISYFLSTKEGQEQIASLTVGTTQGKLALYRIKKIKLPIPSLSEQNTIAKFLSNLDSKINLNKKMNRTLEAVGQAVFRRWFVDFEFPNGEGKPYKSSGGEMVYNSAVDNEIPAKWEAKEIGELAKINELSINRDFKYSEIEYIDIDSVDQGVIRNPQILQLADAPSRAKRIVKNQDIIISTVRPNLKHFAFIQKAKPNTIVSTGFAVISPNKGNSKFLYYHLTADKYTNYLSAIADSHTSTYPSFNPDIIQKSVVAYPDSNEQQVTTNLSSLFDSILEGLFCKVENNSKQISTLSQLRDMLLPKLMSGKIRVPIQKETMEIQ